jgi:hypothetical protein
MIWDRKPPVPGERWDRLGYCQVYLHEATSEGLEWDLMARFGLPVRVWSCAFCGAPICEDDFLAVALVALHALPHAYVDLYTACGDCAHILHACYASGKVPQGAHEPQWGPHRVD